VINRVKELGDKLPAVAGQVADIGTKKRWLTEWDLRIETELTTLIKSLPGEHTIFAEEIHDKYVESENTWIIDPISNTKGFVNSWPHYAVVVSHLYMGELKFAAVYDPSMQEMFTAIKGEGAFLNDKKITVPTRPDHYYFLLSFSRDQQLYSLDKHIDVYSELIRIGSVRNIGALGLHYAYVACGRADCAIAFNKDMFPEFAGKLILEEAGGVMTDFEGNDITPNSRGIIASRKDKHSEFLNLIQKTINI
jgi:myo-inositol-1(or 4)-monophosphatase